jgi:pSer/pThr/pTyr-binding forkhead associated (FHA) protein
MTRAKPASQSPLGGRLVFEDGPLEGTTFPIILKETLVGRLDSAQLVIEAPGVSRLHARLVFDKGEVWIEDLDSREGTWLNGVAVERAHLKDGDRVCFGDTVLRYER